MSKNRGKSGGAEADYHSLAKGWESDRVASSNRSKKIAWSVAGVANLVAVAQGIGLLALLPLKQTEPYVMAVDRATGAVEAVSRLVDASETQTEAVNKYNVARYVRYREEYSREIADVNYRGAMLMSSAQVGNIFHEQYRPENPQSPLRIYGNTSNVRIRILNVSFVAPEVASIRYEKTIRTGDQTSRSTWTATVAFRYSNAAMSEADRLINPVGFIVTDYRNDPEVGG